LQFPSLAPLPYHREVVDYLRTEEPDVWRWACSAQAREEHAAAVRGDLLRQTYRLDADAHPELHACCEAAARRLGLNLPVTLYQAGEGTMNAGLFYMPGEAHVVFFGAILERLKGPQLEALIGHELAHHLFWTLEGGIYHAADRILSACAHDPRAEPAHVRTARLYGLFTEVLADRGSAIACGALDPAIASLVKVQTGLVEVSAASYLRQAREVLESGAKAEGQTHPEVFQRARALEMWCGADAGTEQWITDALRGAVSADSPDVLGQQALTSLTRAVLGEILRPRCLRSDLMLAHARRFFGDYAPADTPDETLAGRIAGLRGAQDYVAALLMDFATVDRELDDVPLAAAFENARRFGVEQSFETLSAKHLELPKRRVTKIKRDAASILEQAERRHG
jgi:hypothetical protein